MKPSLLTNDQLLFVQEEKDLLAEISALFLQDGHFSATDLDALQKAIRQLDELFLIVVVGEFNAGKSALLNALLGEKILAEGLTPTTSQVNLIRFGKSFTTQVLDEGFAMISYPLELLKQINFVDSPGTNAIHRQHERLTREFIPRSDLVLFVTSADHPLTESERQFLQSILDWGKKVILVINKADILEDAQAVDEVREFVRTNTGALFGQDPQVFVVSARLAQRAFLQTDPAQKARKASGMDALESYIVDSLDENCRLELKLNSPLGVARKMHLQCTENIRQQQASLAEDIALVDQLNSLQLACNKEMQAELTPRLAEIEKILNDFELRGQAFYDRELRLLRIVKLSKSDKVKQQFEEEVLRDVSEEIDEKVRALIDWMLDKELNAWYRASSALQKRQELVGQKKPVEDETWRRRKDLIDSIGKTIKIIINGYDRQQEAEKLGELVQESVSQTALFGVGALGMGALVATVITSTALDVSGLVAAGTMALLGLCVIPYKRKQAKDGFKVRMDELRTGLDSKLRSGFTREFAQMSTRLEGLISPYSIFVHKEQQELQAKAARMLDVEARLLAMQARVETVSKLK